MQTPTIVRGTNDKPAASDSLAAFFESATDLDGQLFIGYPIIGGADGKHPIDAVYVSPTRGIIVFDLVDGLSVDGYEDRQDDAATKLESRLLTHRDLVHRRKLIPTLHTITYAPAIPRVDDFTVEGYPVANFDTLRAEIHDASWEEGTSELYARTLSALQNLSTIRKSRASRDVTSPDSRGAKLQRLENSIATLDNLQGKAVIETVPGVQRIRGLAGSGKTIVLALKAAYLHAQHPDWRIAVTFNTRSLREQFQRLITNFSIEAGEEPDWSMLRIIPAWGAPGGGNREGIYHQFCTDNGIEYCDFNTARARFGREGAFNGACLSALEAVTLPVASYDVILIDEAQDFPPSFLRLCYSALGEPKRMVYAYDELQNLSGTGMPSATEIFGVDKSGRPVVSLEDSTYDHGARRDIILEKCYRNSRPVLTTAHALGFGIYRVPPTPERTGLVQIFDHEDLWRDIGYSVKSGTLAPGEEVSLERTAATSPVFLESHSSLNDLVQFGCFDSADEQNEWIAQSIKYNLEHDELRHDDIIVINPDPVTARSNLGRIRSRLLDYGVASHHAGVDTATDVFFRPDSASVTFTGIFRAKGNEAAMVYVVNSHECYNNDPNLARRRNMLFTAITRSKAWVRVLGHGPDMIKLYDEYKRLEENSYRLDFRYPTEKERALLQVVHRDMTPDELRTVRKQRESLGELVEGLQSGRVFVEDLDAGLLAQLSDLLGKRLDQE